MIDTTRNGNVGLFDLERNYGFIQELGLSIEASLDTHNFIFIPFAGTHGLEQPNVSMMQDVMKPYVLNDFVILAEAPFTCHLSIQCPGPGPL